MSRVGRTRLKLTPLEENLENIDEGEETQVVEYLFSCDRSIMTILDEQRIFSTVFFVLDISETPNLLLTANALQLI